MKFLRLLLLLLSLSLGRMEGYGNYTFRLIDTTNGLPDNEVKAFFTLPDGRWGMRTTSGLSLYDGCSFRTFPSTGDDACGMDYVSSLPYVYVDARQRVWVKEPGRLLVFDVTTETYLHDLQRLLSALGIRESICDFYIDEAKDYWVVTASGRLLLSHNGKSTCMKVKVKGLRDICRVGNRAWLVYGDGRLVLLDIKANRAFGTQTLWQGKVLDRDFVRFAKSGNHLWVMWNHGVAYCRLHDTQWKPLYDVPNNTLVAICGDTDGRAFVGVRHGGLLTLDSQGNHQIQTTFPTTAGERLVDDIQTVSTIDGTLVLGLYAKGLCLYNAGMETFPFVPLSDYHMTGIGNYKMADGPDGKPMMACSDGMWLFNPTDRSLTPYTEQVKGKDIIRCFLDSRKRVWAGTFRQGMYCIESPGNIIHYMQGEETTKDVNYDIVRCFAEDRQHRIWVSYHGGIGRVDERRRCIVPVRHKRLEGIKNINVIAFDQRQNLWLATNDGLFRYSPTSNKVWSASDLVKDRETAERLRGICRMVYVDSRDLVWVGTFNGLYAIDPKTGDVRSYGRPQGMPNEMIQGIMEDRLGNVWVTTANGLCRFQARNRDFRLMVFDAQNKLSDSKFLPMALAHGTDGLLLFGCANGFYTVDPDLYGIPRYKGHPMLTALEINNQPAVTGKEYGGRVLLPSALSTTQKIVLKHDENFLSFRFSGLNFDMPHHTYYKHRLKGIDEQWIETSPQDGVGSATYTNLAPGNYELEVFSAGFDKVWSKQSAKLQIVVKPPLWATWWAKTFYVLLFAGILAWGLRWKMEQNRKRLEDEKHRELEEMKYRFFTNISHEFRTLLTLIITPVGSLLRRATDDETRQQLGNVSKSAGDLLQLVNQLLDFRKMEMNGERLKLASGNLDEFIRYTTMKFTPLSEQKGIRLAFEDRTGGLFMYFDRDKVGKILTNLLSNAFKFTKAGGGVCVTLEKHLTDSRRYARITVADTGCGIAAEAQGRVFERFYRAEQDSGSQQAGSGIGLNMVQEYVKLHGGTIALESELGKGSRFIVDLPTDLKPETQPQQEETAHKGGPSDTPAAETRGKQEKSVLVVEDNDDFRLFLVRELGRVYNKVITARDGIEGAVLAESEMPDIVVSDVMMPRMSGTALCRRIKENIATSHIPVVLLTAWSTDESRTEGYKAGADAYIAKPFDMEVLLARIGNLLEKQEKRQKDFSHSLSLDPKSVTDSTPDEHFLQEIIACIKKHLDDSEYTIDALADDVVMSRMSLYRKMKALTGQTPADFIRTVRLKTAAQLLKQGQCNVSEACYRTGFASPQNFSRHFKEMFGVLPSQYS